MFTYQDSTIQNISGHQVGNKTTGEELRLSDEELNLNSPELRSVVRKCFLSGFKSPEMYQFTFSNDDYTLNPLFAFSASIFQDPSNFHLNSRHIAKLLFECAQHPNIKSGDFFVAYIRDIKLNDDYTEAVGLFKSETKDDFLKVSHSDNRYDLQSDSGVNTDKLDKGCLIFNTDQDEGFKIMVLDRSNKSEAQYWLNTFLNVKPCSDEYHQTKNFLSLTKTYITEKLPEHFELPKTDQIDLLNKSVDYFKINDQFNQDEFTDQVFANSGITKDFRSFQKEFELENDVACDNSFEISSSAVKKQSRIFKSVLKLDSNFHVYIHGDKSQIERGRDDNGRKFYKLYYEEEK